MLAGCTSPKYNYTPATQQISEPPIGSTNTAYVGDSLLRQGISAQLDGIKVTAPARVSWGYTVTPGEFKKIGEDGQNEFYMPTPGASSGGVDKAVLADMWQAVMAKKGSQTLCVITVFSVSTCENGMPFQRIKLNMSAESDFQQTLLYNGRVGKKSILAIASLVTVWRAQPSTTMSSMISLSQTSLVIKGRGSKY
ncbi:hypothetical protein SOD_c10290 [Serratia plymuthica 4Rx13]|nr:hypothetical protein SOD_c10290 [Serratia plymuthica 4Rx13]